MTNTPVDRYGAYDLEMPAEEVKEVLHTAASDAELAELSEKIDNHKATAILDHPDGSVTNEKLAADSVSKDKIQNGAVSSEKLSAIASIDKLGCIKLYQSGGINRSGLVVDSTGAAYVNVFPDYGLSRSGDGKVIISAASDDEVAQGTDTYKPVTPKTLKTVTDELSRFVKNGASGTTIDSNDSEGEGIYHFYGNITNNYPYDTDGVLLQVDVEGLIHQVLFRQDRTIVMRVKTEGTWGAWKDVADDKIYEADISKVGSGNNILYITVPGVTSYDDLNGKTVKLYTGIYSNNKTQTVYVNINGLGAKAIWRATADGTYQNCTYEPYEVNRYTVMELYFTGGTAHWVNPPSVITSTEKAEIRNKLEELAENIPADTIMNYDINAPLSLSDIFSDEQLYNEVFEQSGSKLMWICNDYGTDIVSSPSLAVSGKLICPPVTSAVSGGRDEYYYTITGVSNEIKSGHSYLAFVSSVPFKGEDDTNYTPGELVLLADTTEHENRNVLDNITELDINAWNTISIAENIAFFSGDRRYITMTEIADGIDSKADKTNYINSEKTTASITLSDNTEYRFSNDMTSLSVSFPDTYSDNYISSFSFVCGADDFNFTAPSNIYFKGEDCIDGVFVPCQTDKSYDVVVWYNGRDFKGVIG